MSKQRDKQQNKNKDKLPTGPKFNTWLTYGVIAFSIFVLINIFSYDGSSSEEITQKEFLTQMLTSQDVDKVVVVNKERVDIYIKPERLGKNRYQDVATTNFNKENLGPHFYFQIGDVRVFDEDLKEAEIMLRQLRGRCHQVHTGIALIHKARDFSLALVETALVWIKDFDEEELSKYLKTGESLGKAGAYSIQGEGARLIEKIEGDYPIIVGLPLWHTAKLLEKQGVVLPISVEEIYQIKPYNNWKDFS